MTHYQMDLPQNFPCLLSPRPARPCDWQPAPTHPSHSSSWRLPPCSCLMLCSRVTSKSSPCRWLSRSSLFPELSQRPGGLQCNLHLENSQAKISFGNPTVNVSLPWVKRQSPPCSHAHAPRSTHVQPPLHCYSVHLTCVGTSCGGM